MSKKLLQIIQQWGFPALLGLVVVAAYVTRPRWWPPLTRWVEGTIQALRPEADEQQNAESERSAKLQRIAELQVGGGRAVAVADDEIAGGRQRHDQQRRERG